ncbi:DNA gyrase inhibitor YacG [Bdellovibrio sp. qaytius]|nr:DNA gyrase inhibitor YacG [Bdellovibrio sp. qaytius]
MTDNTNSSNARKVKCPQCGLLALYSPENKARPFCSDRCKLIDLGEWASEGYKVPIQQQEYNEKDLEQLYQALGDENLNTEEPDESK